MDIVIGAITEVVKFFVSPFMHHISYLIHYKRNANDLRKQMESLKKLKADVQGSVERAHMGGEVIKVVVEDWLTRANQIHYEEAKLQNAMIDNKGCLQGGCSRRYQIGKDSKSMIDEVKELLNEGRRFSVVSDPSLCPPSLDFIQTLDFQVYDSTKLAMDKIMEALKDENINMIGVYGIGGVGKTILMKEMAKILKKDKFFDQVVMVTMSQDPILTKIQGEIAENLGLTLTQESLSVRARVLFERLKKEKRILIVLDDLWKPLNLIDDIGIPYGINCKVILTTRQLQVCNQMKTQFDVEVKVLSEGDAWVLFKWAVGDRIEDDNVLHPVAKQIVRECGGLPLAIVTIGRALRVEDRSMWADAANQLKKSSSSPPDIEGMHEKVFRSIKMSYDFLGREETKFCLLLCCMFPEDSIISDYDLLPYVVGEEVFGNIDSLMDARKRLHTQLERLKGSCLLLDDSHGSSEDYVKMHDVIRDVSIWIASNELGRDFVVKSGRGLTHWPDKEKNLSKCKRLSLMQNNITKLPDQLDCSQLVTLSLRENTNLREIPDGFFQGMISLKILDLNRVCISSIPSSLSCLTDLRVLLLDNKWHHIWYSDDLPLDVSLIGKLKKLEILHIKKCKVENLPQGIGELTNLKSLDLSYIDNLTIPPNIISRLSLLEELCLFNSFENWELEGSISSSSSEVKEEDRERSKAACLSEVASLSSLTKLEITVSNPKFLCANFSSLWENLTSFSIRVGRECDTIRTLDTRAMVISGMIPPASISEWVRMFLLEQIEWLALNSCMGIKDVVSLGKMGLNKLRTLLVEDCDDVEYVLMNNTSVVDEVVDHHQEIPQIAFSSLERLCLLSLKKLKAICHGPLPIPNPIPSRGGCFNNLRSLYVSHCSSLTVMIPSNLLANLQNLEELNVSSCYGLTEVFNSMGIVDHGQAIMTKLRELELVYLPLLKTIWEGVFSPLSLLNLEKIIVEQLDGLNFMFSIAMAQGLQQLKQLQIQNCKEMVQIIVINNDNHDIEEEEAAICKTVVLFPQLEDLQLDSLPNLSMLITKGRLLHHDQYNYWPLLETLKVKKCPKLKRLPVTLSPHTETKLREIEVEEKWFNELEWVDRTNDVKMHLQQNVKVTYVSNSDDGDNGDDHNDDDDNDEDADNHSGGGGGGDGGGSGGGGGGSGGGSGNDNND